MFIFFILQKFSCYCEMTQIIIDKLSILKLLILNYVLPFFLSLTKNIQMYVKFMNIQIM